MLKSLLLSGWFRVQPFLKYVLVVILIAPLVAASGSSSSAKQSQLVSSIHSDRENLEPELISTLVSGDTDLNQDRLFSQIDSTFNQFNSVPISIAAIGKPRLIQADAIDFLAEPENSDQTENTTENQLLAAVELAPSINADADSISSKQISNDRKLVARLKSHKVQTLVRVESLDRDSVAPWAKVVESEIKQIPVQEEPDPESLAAQQQDPLASPHPIPWKWIMDTQQKMSAKGGSGVRYYRSVPVISPDGRYAVYSRVQLEAEPELHRSRVSSVLFIEDRKTKQLRVISSTSRNTDVLLKVKHDEADQNGQGTLGVLVPVSWSQQGDRFLARSFVSKFQTSDGSDSAVIWNRQKNNVDEISPENKKDSHEQVAVMLGWSQSQPDHVLFRAGELGEEEWPLVAVSNDGQTFAAEKLDRPITFGHKISDVWDQPEVAYR